MPERILNAELYADRTVQDWHRATFGRDAWAIDLDLMGACHYCKEPLYLIESSTNPDKPTTILKRLGVRAEVAALLVIHRKGVVVRARWVHSLIENPQPMPDEEALKDALTALRFEHPCQVRELHERRRNGG